MWVKSAKCGRAIKKPKTCSEYTVWSDISTLHTLSTNRITQTISVFSLSLSLSLHLLFSYLVGLDCDDDHWCWWSHLPTSNNGPVGWLDPKGEPSIPCYLIVHNAHMHTNGNWVFVLFISTNVVLYCASIHIYIIMYLKDTILLEFWLMLVSNIGQTRVRIIVHKYDNFSCFPIFTGKLVYLKMWRL